jgi:iron complex outermembrane receptor protein
MHQTNTNFGEEYLIPDAMTNGVFGTVNYEWKTNVLQAGLRFDNRQITTEENGTLGEEGYFKAIDKSLIVSMLLGIKRSYGCHDFTSECGFRI